MMRPPLIFFKWLGVVSIAPFLALSSTVAGSIELTPNSQSFREGLPDIVVWLEPLHSLPNPPAQKQHVQLLQKNKMFHPHVLAVMVGSTVDFPNADPIFHSAFSNFNGQLFDLTLYPPGTTKSVYFHRAGIVRVFCNIHPSMSAVIVVLDTPYFTKANLDGTYELANVPAGSYKLHVFDERATTTLDSEPLVNVERESDATKIPPVRISEAGYVQPPHKNKYGLEYPPSSEDRETYSGLPK